MTLLYCSISECYFSYHTGAQISNWVAEWFLNQPECQTVVVDL